MLMLLSIGLVVVSAGSLYVISRADIDPTFEMLFGGGHHLPADIRVAGVATMLGSIMVAIATLWGVIQHLAPQVIP